MSNRLILVTSPYLLQHAQNPVEWYPWCQEAFDKAKAEHKPIIFKRWLQRLSLVPCNGTREL